jgi:uncharacterized membrane protein YdjX (TVP38/TMEM64 family)
LIEQIAAFLSTSQEPTPYALGLLTLVFVASGFVLLPRILICVLAGATYGYVAILIAIPGITLGALMAFLAARYLAQDLVQRAVARRRMLKRVSRAVDQEGWRIIALMRLGAPVPGAFTNYVFGLTSINWWSFTWATFVFCIPQIVLFVVLGAAGRAALLEDSGSAVSQVLIALAVVTLGAIIYLIMRRARSSLDDFGPEAAAEGKNKDPV